jgi:transcriptional regulator with XRE-family HTH domain
MNIREVMAVNLRRYRRAQRVSQEELAHRAEIDRTYISSIERCVYAASVDVVDRLAAGLGLGAADLLKRPEPDRGANKKSVSKRKPRTKKSNPVVEQRGARSLLGIVNEESKTCRKGFRSHFSAKTPRSLRCFVSRTLFEDEWTRAARGRAG